ncbi:YgaP family membrane protein [Reichenbachiella sp.]
MQNVGKIDSMIRIILGICCIVAIVYNYTVETILPLYGVILVAILIPLFLKTGITKFCPIMKGLGVSTKK